MRRRIRCIREARCIYKVPVACCSSRVFPTMADDHVLSLALVYLSISYICCRSGRISSLPLELRPALITKHKDLRLPHFDICKTLYKAGARLSKLGPEKHCGEINAQHCKRRVLTDSDNLVLSVSAQQSYFTIVSSPRRRVDTDAWRDPDETDFLIMISVTVVLLAATLVTALITRQVHVYNSLKAFGGHWSAGWSRLWQLKTQSSGEMHKRFSDINHKYGSTARIAPRTLITCDPDLIRTMNAVRSTYTRGIWYSALKLHPDIDNITSHTNERIHGDLRSKMAPGYSGKENSHMENDVDAQVLSLLELLDQKYVAKPEKGIFRSVDLARVTNFFTLDVISSIAFGQTFGFLVEDEDPFGYIENVSRLLPAIILFGVYTELTKLLNVSFIKAALPKSSDKRGLGRVMGFAKARVDERFGANKIERKDMLGSFIKKGLSQQQLESETLTQIIAGSDSTASALRMTLHFLATSPPILARLLQEVEHAINAGLVSRPVIKDSEARKLPYLQACIKEGLRIYPPVTGLLAKQVQAGGAWIDVDGVKKFAPGGTQIGWNSWAIGHNKAIFGVDCDIFRPERWLSIDRSQAEHDRVTRMTDTVGLVFGYGRFGCLGQGVATMELNKAVIEILLRYNLQPCSLAKPFDEKAVGFWIHENMDFVLTERNTYDITTVLNGHVGIDALPGAYEA